MATRCVLCSAPHRQLVIREVNKVLYLGGVAQ